MNILIITPNYLPDLGPSAPLFSLLAETLVQRGHRVTVICAVPHYPTGQVPIEYRSVWFRRSLENGVNVIRVGLPSLRRQYLAQRMLQFMLFQLGAALASLGARYDAAIVANPALQVWLPFTWAALVRRKAVIYSVHDVYPDVGIKLGIFRSPAQVGMVAWLERFCLKRAAKVRILADSFRAPLQKLGVEDAKITLVYDWVDTSLIHPLPHDNEFSRQYGLCSSFVVLYAGNLGLSQGLEHLLTTAQILAGEKDIRFVFVGDGSGRETLHQRAGEMQLRNVEFIPFQPRERLPAVLASADVSVVILKHGIATASLPSKMYSNMASGKAILISVDQESEAWQLIHQAGAGCWAPPEDPAALADAILALKRDHAMRQQLGQNGRLWAEQHHSARYAAEQFEGLLHEAMQQKQGRA